MPVAGNVVPIDAGAERQMGEDRQLLGGVAAVDVQRRVGLGVAQPLGLGDRVGVRRALARPSA